MKKLLSKLLFALLPAAHAADERLTRIVQEYEIREQADDSTLAHSKWISTTAGEDDSTYIASNFDRLTDQQRYEIPTELARTGRLAVVPLLEKAFAKSSSALAGVFFACHLGSIESGFGKAVAPLVLPWVGKSMIESRDTALMLLPVLDADLAAKFLFADNYVGLTAPKVHWVLASCNEAGLKIPRAVIDPLLVAWEKAALDTQAEYRVELGFLESLKALAVHDPQSATEKATKIIRTKPQWAEKLADLPLMATGLTGLYDKLADMGDEKRAVLPESAQIYFAVTYFESDCSNGGLVQALSNSTGDHLPLVRKGYEAVGDQRSMQWLDWMCQPFGEAGPSTDRANRVKQMESMIPSYFEQEEQLSQIWIDQHRDDPPQIATSWMLALYVAKEAAEIRRALSLPNP